MLKAMRQNLKSLKPVLWLVIGAFLVSIFILWGRGTFEGSGKKNTLVEVGKEKITADEYYQILRQRLESMQKEFEGLNSALIQQLNIPQQILEQSIQQRLLLQIAKDMGLRASDEEVGERVKTYFQRDGQFVGYQEYKQTLDYYRMSVGEFEKGIADEVLLTKVVKVLTAGVVMTEDEVWSAYQKQNDSAKIEYLVSDKDKTEITDKPTAEDVEDYFDGNREGYKIPERRTADYVFLKGEDFKAEITIQDKEIEQYYQDNINQFKEPETTQVGRIFLAYSEENKESVLSRGRDILQRARSGEDFAELASTYSEDDKAATGGDWGLFEWRSLSSGETEAVGRLDAGGVSDVIETEEGAAILKVTEKIPEVTKTLDDVRTTITGILEDEKTRNLVSDRIQSLERRARKEASLDVAAQMEGLKFSSTGPLERGQGLGDFDTSGAVSEALFGLEEKEISSPIYTYNGAGLAQLQEIEAERPATLEEVRDEVEAELIEKLKTERAREKLAAFKASGTADWINAAAPNAFEYKSVDEHKREQYLSLVGENPKVDQLVFSLPLKEASEPIEVEDGYAIFRVLDRKEVIREDFDAVKTTEWETALEQKKNKFLQSCLVKAREEKKVRINYELFLRLNNEILSGFTGEE